ncbi:TraB/GumN family protein [Undibacterium sp. TS12]|uniref:TraB/GumN family protein n=1 Tax=Undibacterium sp. TS12 TaxID=2908202 RepID=UPI001F4CD07F|nr:TraB/GumN family protein [Undibacterium sp. TS12]MCH8618320.1 TraB/GumN family protein [Undibacterium sp. TS12]
MKLKSAFSQLMFKYVTVLGLALTLGTAYAQAEKETPAKGVMWEVKSEKNTAYLFGSFHLAKASFYPMPEAVEQAYKQADTLVVEVDTTDAKAAEKTMPLFTYAAPDKLENHISKKTWENLQAMVGSSVVQFQSLKPTIAATALTLSLFRQQGYDASKGVDLHYLLRAKQDKKDIVELESLAFQASMLGSLNDEDADAMLAQTLDGLKNGDILRETADMIEAWKNGDAENLAKILLHAANKDAGSKKLMKILLDDRNPGMTEKIVDMLNKEKKLFIVVGAGHFSGPNSILDMLEKQGLQVRQIK